MPRISVVEIVGGREVTCRGDQRDRYKRLIGICYVGSHDINAEMVRRGWAVAYRRYSKDYVDEEDVAKDSRIGMWQGKFMMPWKWRKRK